MHACACVQELDHQALDSLLVAPCQRMPKCLLLLKELVKARRKKDAADDRLGEMEALVADLEDVVVDMNTRKGAHELQHNFEQLQAAMVGLGVDLIHPRRRCLAQRNAFRVIHAIAVSDKCLIIAA